MSLNQANSSKRIPQLDGVRALSILLVLGAHLIPLKLPGGIKYFHFNATAGVMGMSLFFTLSGFLVTSALLRNQDVYDFFIRRFTRVIPLAYVFSIIVFFLSGMNIDTLIGHLLFLTNYEAFQATQYSSHYWSLGVEMTFYSSVGLIVLVAGRPGLILIPVACLAITALRIHEQVPVAIATRFRIDEILSGGIVALLYVNYFGDTAILRNIQTVIKRGLPFWFGLWALSCYYPFGGYFLYIRPYTAALLVFSIILTDNKIVLSYLSNGVFSYIARISYALYIIHGAARAGVLSGGTKAELYLVKRPITFLISFVGAHISTFYWEQYWLDKARAHLRKRKLKLQQVTKATS